MLSDTTTSTVKYGISVFATRDATVDATGRNPRHFTVVFDQLDPGVEALISCEHVSWVNPYHEG